MFKKLVLVLAVALAAGAAWIYTRRSTPPEVPVALASRGRIESVVTTNGKVEPVEWASARAEVEGVVERVPVARGQNVRRGAALATLDSRAARAQLSAAEARIAQASVEMDVFDKGGRPAELGEIDAQLRKVEVDRTIAQREADSVERLVNKNATTNQELIDARDKLTRLTVEAENLKQRRGTFVSRGDVAAARSRLAEAQADAADARRRIDLSTVRAPMDGVVYQLEARTGAYLTPGALVANVGRIDRLKVILFVDEPDLGRVAKGMTVTFTWDALAGRKWTGVVDRVPTQVVPLGTRQVGEVTCLIENRGLELLPGVNINATIGSRAVENALSVPKEALRREGADTGVYIVKDGRLAWRPLKLGISSVTHSEVVSGLEENDAVVLLTDVRLRDGLEVTTVNR